MKKVNWKKIRIINAFINSLNMDKNYSREGIILILKGAGITDKEEAEIRLILADFSCRIVSVVDKKRNNNMIIKFSEISSEKNYNKTLLDLIFEYDFRLDNAESAMFFNINNFSKELEIELPFKDFNEVYEKIAINHKAIEERWKEYFVSDEYKKYIHEDKRNGDFIYEAEKLKKTYSGNMFAADKYLQEKGF